MVTEVRLQQALLDEGVERVSWWNGRVLTAEDLADLQRATDEADLRLGTAIGPGVVRGLTVERAGDSSVVVGRGVAVDRAGEVLSLPLPARVPLVTPPEAPSGGPAAFVTCPDLPTALKATGYGAYLLTLGSAAGTRGAATGADVRGIATRECGPRYLVAGVQFRLVRLDLADLAEKADHDSDDVAVLETVLSAADDHPRARNIVAALLLDTVARRRALIDPFGAGASHVPLLDRLHEDGVLTDCEVPLAVVTWQAGTIGFIDAWSVRRSPRREAGRWPARVLAADGAAAGLAALLQFGAHLDELIDERHAAGDVSELRLLDVARYVPPAMLLKRATGGHPRGVTLQAFLGGLERRGGGQIAGGRVWPLMDASLLSPPLDLDGEGRVHTYEIREAVGAPGVQRSTLVIADHLTHLALAPEDDADRMEITSVSPAGEHPIRSEISVHGRNFGSPTSTNHVTVGGVAIPGFNSPSNTEVLTFNIPEVPDVPRVVPIVVAKGDETAEYLISVVPRSVTPRGEIQFTDDNGHLDGVDLVEEHEYVFWWWVKPLTNVATEFRFSPRFTDAHGAELDDWASEARVVDAEEQAQDHFTLIPGDPEHVEGAGPVRIGIKVTVPVGAEQVDLALRAECLAAPDDTRLNRPSGPVLIVVGSAVEPNDPRIGFGAPVLTMEGGEITDDGEIVLFGAARNRVRVEAFFEEAGEFTFEADVQPDPGPWTLTGPDPEPDAQWQEPANGFRRLTVFIEPSTTGPETHRFLRMRVRSAGDEEYGSSLRIPMRAE